MLIQTKELTEEQIKRIEEMLGEMKIPFTMNSRENIYKYKDELKQELEQVIDHTNGFFIQTVDLITKAAMPAEWIGQETELQYTYGNVIAHGETRMELLSEVLKEEEVEDLLCYLKDNISIDVESSFEEFEFSFDSKLENIIQIF
ncbi:hypothetical protein MZM54_00960 [[Brevibacterium] frigoritolerans]|nr:hypothetical protein [Peribacillus frigoritolerans]